MRLSVVIPCFNEELNIQRFESELLPPLKSLGVPFEILAVDDGSTDASLQSLKGLSKRLPELRVLSHGSNRGLGAALRTAFLEATGDWIVVLDADLTFSPDQITALLQKQLETGADLIGGSPFLAPGGFFGVPWTRRLPSLILNAFYRGLFDRRLTAYTPLFRLYCAVHLKAMHLVSQGFEINAEIAARFIRTRRRFAEVPAVLTERSRGASKLNRWRELARHVRLILRLLSGAA